MKIIYVIIGVLFASNLLSQNTIEEVITQVEQNNTTLMALRQRVDADKIGNKTNVSLDNPELEFNYLWGNPTGIGNRTDFALQQSFDFPTAYVYRNQILNLRNEQAELEYIKQQKEIVLKAKQVCIDLVYLNALRQDFAERLENAERIAISFQTKLDVGESSVLEYNKAKLNLLNITSEMQSVEAQRQTLLAQLCALNGGQFIDFTQVEYAPLSIAEDFEIWYENISANNPVLIWLKNEVDIKQKEVGLNKAMGLPKFQVGYMSETVVGSKYQGVSFGVSIPLWENKNKVKYAKANALAIESMQEDIKLQQYNTLRALHAKAFVLHDNVSEYNASLAQLNNSELLRKALDAGEISLINYLFEQSFYYDSKKNLLEMEREMHKAYAELIQYL